MTRVPASSGSRRGTKAPACIGICVWIASLVTISCGRTPDVKLPSGTGSPFPQFADAYGQATEPCHNLVSLTAVLSMSGRAGRQNLRGRIDAGLAQPDRIALEGVAPFGKPFFVLTAADGASTLVLPRDGRYLRGAAPAEIIEALTGIRIAPNELMIALGGCAFYVGSVSDGRTFANGWAAVDAGSATVWLRMIDGSWREVAAERGPLTIYYDDFAEGRPQRLRLVMKPPDGAGADITLRVSQLELGKPLDPAVFKLAIPEGAQPLTLDELRRAGPLGGEAKRE
ncbi:MAG TPA: hypothetical protein VFT39_04755 [Vicinamibacterales bacterium]|nr:hypothetical protein [Vicinamibacterales bacterium]